jgi:hypothetical protein
MGRPPGKEGVQAGPLDRVQVGRAGVQAEAKLTGEPAQLAVGEGRDRAAAQGQAGVAEGVPEQGREPAGPARRHQRRAPPPGDRHGRGIGSASASAVTTLTLPNPASRHVHAPANLSQAVPASELPVSARDAERPGPVGARVVQGLLGYWGCCWSSKVW